MSSLNLDPNVQTLLERLDGYRPQVEALRVSPAGVELTSRRMDEAGPAGRRVYTEAARSIEAGYDNLRGLHVLMESGLSLWPCWSLMRTILECGFWASWVLLPDDGAERRRRGLRRELQDHLEWKKHAEDFSRTDAARSLQLADHLLSVEAPYRSEAAALGLSWSEAKNKLDVITSMRALHTDHLLFVSAWRRLSGATHGHMWSLLMNSDRTELQRQEGGALMHLVINDARFNEDLTACLLQLHMAVQLYIGRSTNAIRLEARHKTYEELVRRR